MTSWIVIEILSRPGLIDRIREEVTRAVTTDAKTGSPIVNIPLLVTLPLLHSVYSECLRLRNSVQVVRQLRNDLEVDGYVLKAGNLVIAPSWLAHRDSSTWSSPGHDLNGDSHLANDFWAERFLHRGKTTMESGNYFPYGGGTAACPGRYYAKQEILAAVALLVAYCEFEPISFVDQSGQRSDSGPQVGSEARGVARIDRDLLVRMRRRSMGEGVRFLI
jgi:cytochrome P450